LLRIAEVLQKENGTKIIVTRHGLEWWTNWFTRIPVAQDRSMDASLFAEYDRVYLLKMKSDQHGPPMGMKNEEEPKFTVTDTLYNEEGASLVELAKK
jgi:energy-coupling factor transporter ATP-binding protein EcfA2